MSALLGNAIVGQSGGPTAAINATLAGVIRGARAAAACGTLGVLYGMRNGIEGLLREDLVDLSARCLTEEDLTLLADTPAAALGSCRVKLPESLSDPVYEKLFSIFKARQIRFFFYIGGNDSMDTVDKLTRYAQTQGYDMRFIGVPKTIDNDLSHTDHTPGFGSAAKYIATTTQEIIADCSVYTKPAVTIVEIMGRDAGWLTAASALPRLSSGVCPDLVYLPELPFSMPDFLRDVQASLARHPAVVVTVSEGLRYADGGYVGAPAQSGARDVFGHSYLSGTGKALELAVKDAVGCKVRSVELNLPQRCAGHLTSATDIRESMEIGQASVEAALSGTTGHVMTFRRTSTEPYAVTIASCAVGEVANQVRRVPRELIHEAGNHVTDACLSYLLPLIAGERHPSYRLGLPVHFRL
ncbi:MAG: 6-phosphofructokinase [Eubacteriales bacterium]